MRGLEVTDKGFEVLGYELGAIVGDNARAEARIGFVGALQDDLSIGFLHRGPNVPGEDGARAAIKDRAEIVEGAGDIDVGEVDVPVVVRFDGLEKTGAFLGWLGIPGLGANQPP